jgi:NCAIR mutase (PurE)-related protein
VTTAQAIQLLESYRAGKTSRDQVLRAFQAAPVADIGFAQVDTHRALRKGFPRSSSARAKRPAQVVGIASKLLEQSQNVLVTRITGGTRAGAEEKIQTANITNSPAA